ncbi:MAG: oligopeptide transporter, OPT family, partial [Acidobacteria bacterium]|nr:oligopeptide transporter, OPT family [Acidobacteriota bacterium]
AQKARVENAGVLTASGLIAGEAMTGLVVATFRFFEWPLPQIFKDPSILAGFGVLGLIAFVMVGVPLRNACRPDEPAPPTAIM